MVDITTLLFGQPSLISGKVNGLFSMLPHMLPCQGFDLANSLFDVASNHFRSLFKISKFSGCLMFLGLNLMMSGLRKKI